MLMFRWFKCTLTCLTELLPRLSLAAVQQLELTEIIRQILLFVHLLLTDNLHQWRIYHWATWAMDPPLWTARKSPIWQKCNQNAPFSGKKSQKFSTAPSPDCTLLGRWIPLTRPLTPLGACGASPRPPPIFSPISIITLDYDAVIDEFGKSNRRLVLLVDLGLLNGTRLEMGPVNIQSSHWINLLMQFVMDWRTLANSIINKKTLILYHVRHLHI